jgi:hypothetical protein
MPNKPTEKELFKEHYERLDLEDLLEQGKEFLESDTVQQARNWGDRFWLAVKLVVAISIIATILMYGYVLYKVKFAANQYEENQKIQIYKALGEPNE